MEQNNLVVTSDGKTWDEVTRDVSYIGNTVLSANGDTDQHGGSTVNILDEWRGTPSGEYNPNFNKDFAIAYDRVICLKSGQYSIFVSTLAQSTNTAAIKRNGTLVSQSYSTDDETGCASQVILNLWRGDYIQIFGAWYQNEQYNNYTITRM